MTKKNLWEMSRNEKLEYLQETADNAIDRVSYSRADWREFLRFYANLHTYPFSEILTIYEQAPQITACAELKQWNNRGRRVHNGVHGIPVLNESTGNIKYVFDVSDTYGDERGLPKRWTLDDKYKPAVVNELRSRFKINLSSPNDNSNIKWAVEEYVREECADFMENLRYNVDGSYLSDLDDDNIRKEFTDTVVDSVGYLVCERLKIDKGLYDDDNLSFQFLYDFNTRPALSRVGEAVNHISRNVLQIIHEAIIEQQKLEEMRVKSNERFEAEQTNDKRVDAVDEQSYGGGVGAESESGRGNAGSGRIRTDVSGVSENELSGTSDRIGVGDETMGHLRGSEQRSDGNDVDADGTVTEAKPAAENGRYAENDTVQHMVTEYGGGNSQDRDNLQVQVEPDQSNEAENESFPLFVGLEFKMGGHIYDVVSIDDESGTVSMLDKTYYNGGGFPIYRTDKIDDILQYLNDLHDCK